MITAMMFWGKKSQKGDNKIIKSNYSIAAIFMISLHHINLLRINIP